MAFDIGDSGVKYQKFFCNVNSELYLPTNHLRNEAELLH